MNIEKSQTHRFLLIVIFVSALILRLHQIDQPFVDAFSWRQADTATMAEHFYRGNWNILYPGISWNGPGDNYQGLEFQLTTFLAALGYTMLGQHDWIGRGIAVGFGLWGIFALYKLVSEVWAQESAIASAAVMAILPGSIFINRAFLPDPVMLSLVTTSFWLLVVYLKTDKTPYLLLAALIGSLGFLTKITGLIVGIPMLYASFEILKIRQRLKLKYFITLAVTAIAVLTPVVSYYLWARHISLAYPPYHIAAKGNWIWDDGLLQWLNEGYFLKQLLHHFNLWLWTFPVIVVVFAGLFLPILERRAPTKQSPKQPSKQPSKQPPKQMPWLFHWWLLGGLIFYLFGAKELVHNPWNFHVITPAAAAIVGAMITHTISVGKRHHRSVLSFVCVGLLFVSVGILGQRGLRAMYYPYAHEGYQLGIALKEWSQPEDLVVTMPNAIGEPVAIYYSQRRGWVFPPAWPEYQWTQLPKNEQLAIEQLTVLRNKGADWFGIVSSQRLALQENLPGFMTYLEDIASSTKESDAWIIYEISSENSLLEE